MADAKLSQLAVKPETLGDPFNDRLYYYASEGVGDDNKQVAVTPWDFLTGHMRWMAHFEADFIGSFSDMTGFGTVETSDQSDPQHPGVVEARATNTDDSAGFWGPYRGTRLTGGAIRMVFIVKIADLSTSGDRYIALCGFLRDGDATLNQNGIYLKYSDNVNAGKWALITRNGSETLVDTGVTVQANTWYRIQIDINADATSASCSIDGSSPVASSTNMYQDEGTISANIRKVNGTNQRRLIVDYVGFMKHLVTGR